LHRRILIVDLSRGSSLFIGLINQLRIFSNSDSAGVEKKFGAYIFL